MKAVFIENMGGLDALKYGDLPTPKTKRGEVLIRVKAAALNHLDLHLRNAKLDIPLPHISGSDVAGLVAEINGQSNLKVGDAVVINPAIPCGTCSRCKRGLSCEIVTIFGYKTPGEDFPYINGILFSEASNLQQLLGSWSSTFNQSTNTPHIFQSYKSKDLPEAFTQIFYYHKFRDNDQMVTLDMREPVKDS